AIPPLRPTVAPEGALPLSLFQERLWILQQLEPQSTTYLMALRLLLPPDRPLQELIAAVQRVHARHLGLRVVFAQEGEALVARRAELPPVRVHDHRRTPPEQGLAEVDAAVERAVHTPIDLARETPLRFELLDFSPRGFALVIAAHHIAVDAWSLQILQAELAQELRA